ncbi:MULTISPECIES: TetR/AcrR family transcriptional regulator [Streptomyces]|uniref:TetR/AcrR family transcriptional regulator n=1 Tax=Streptomyces TaxID=1883 RepID=UPI00163B7A02|nr:MULTISPECIES: TetR/AcrR family transcriptional regulator [Streptomyces]MBC2876138.1 TetR/AcrR family transcriptional regulator [Streptomyces sp. TYQ1024]UBI38495.1 TetR/AcrR family transcriptional regulator [Streptomyces mobaraensis]UKW31079.1 TetR/AcrR family transcriptional regulator [Streptomyces sp. TYQ1024]
MTGRREESARESRRRLLEAATELVAEGGPRAASVQAVADRAGISRGSVAWHFGSKEGLIVEVIGQAFHAAEEEYRRVLPETGPLTFDALLDAHLTVVDAPCGRVFATVLPEVMGGPGPLRDAYVRGYEGTRRVWIGYLERITAGTPGLPDAKSLASLVFGSGVGVNTLHGLDGLVDRAEAFAALRTLFELAGGTAPAADG